MVYLKEFLKKDDFEKNQQKKKNHENPAACKELTLKAPITTAADDKFCNIFPNFSKEIRNDI